MYSWERCIYSLEFGLFPLPVWTRAPWFCFMVASQVLGDRACGPLQGSPVAMGLDLAPCPGADPAIGTCPQGGRQGQPPLRSGPRFSWLRGQPTQPACAQAPGTNMDLTFC